MNGEELNHYGEHTTPGIGGKPFFIKFDRVDWLAKGDIITNGPINCEVLKVYKQTWWRKLLLKLGIKVRLMQVKVKYKSKNVEIK